MQGYTLHVKGTQTCTKTVLNKLMSSLVNDWFYYTLRINLHAKGIPTLMQWWGLSAQMISRAVLAVA